VARLMPLRDQSQSVAVDLMAGTGEIWPHVLRKFPNLGSIIALDISHRMHVEAVERLHSHLAHKIQHLESNVLESDLPEETADLVVSTFGLKTFNKTQQEVLARQIARILKPGGSFSLIEASDPKSWKLRPFYRFYLDNLLPKIERFFLQGANDFSMIGTYTKNYEDSSHFAEALRANGLIVSYQKHFFGCATSVAGHKPEAIE